MRTYNIRAVAHSVWTLGQLGVLALLLVVLACSKDNDKEDPMLEVSPETLLLGNKGSGVIAITSNSKWSISTTAEWLSFSTKSGVGNGQVTVIAIDKANSDRQAIVDVKGESTTLQVVVNQTGTEMPSPGPTDPSAPTQNSVQTFNVAGFSFNMVRVDGGTFWMGATAEQVSDAYDDENPVHQVTLNTYYIGETEVTQELWQVVMGSNPSRYSGNKRPVESVSWNDCQDFITKLNQMTGQTFRLPTEAEWEYAARGGSVSKGYKYAGSNTIDNVAWFNSNSSSSTHDVATKHANELGIYDMSGNVYEWCQDWYGNYSAGQISNPTGPSTGSGRVYRGGSWGYFARSCRVAYRCDDTPTYRSIRIGFRLALH